MAEPALHTEPLNPEQVIATAGVIYSVQGTNPGPASGITYTVDVNLPGVGVRRFQNVVPHNARWRDELDTRAVQPGSAVMVFILPQNQLQFFIHEFPDDADCDQAAATGGSSNG